MFVFLDLSRLGTVSLAHKTKHQFHTLKLSSLGHHPHSPGYGNSLHQHPQLWNQNCLFWIFLLHLFCILSKKRPSDLSIYPWGLYECVRSKRFLSTALSEDAHEHSFQCRNSPDGCWELAFLFLTCYVLNSCSTHLDLLSWACLLSISRTPCYVYLQLSSLPSIKKDDTVSCFFHHLKFILKNKKKLPYCSCCLLFGLAKSNVNEYFCSHKWTNWFSAKYKVCYRPC